MGKTLGKRHFEEQEWDRKIRLRQLLGKWVVRMGHEYSHQTAGQKS
jgi:hypothetical protein